MRMAVALVALAGVACDGRRGPPPPPSELLVAAGDSTFWIESGGDGIVVRGAPISLARLDGRLYELYVTDDDRSFFDAIMVGQRIFRRDLITGDSVAVVEDTAVANLADAYRVAHPDQRPLAPDEEASDDPATYATADLEVVGVHGPYLSYEQHADIGLPDGSEIHAIRRGVVDLRTSAQRSVSDLFGAREARRLINEARGRFAAGIDSLFASPDEGARELADAMRDLRFDPMSFSIEHLGDEPAVSFLVPGGGEWAIELAVPMSAQPVGAPPWWDEVRESLPGSVDGGESTWRRAGTGVLARRDTAEGVVTVILVDSTAQEWRAARVPDPIHRILWLDRPALDSVSRRALRRAFEEAALYSAETRIARAPARSAPAVFRAVSLDHGRASPRARATAGRAAAGQGRSRSPVAVARPAPTRPRVSGAAGAP